MKFAIVVAGVVVLAGAGAFALTGQPAPPNQLAGDWRCNNKINGVDSATLVSVANDGATRGQLLFNIEREGRWITVETSYTGRLRVEGREVVEDAATLTIDEASVDGLQLPASMKASIRAQMQTGTERYALDEISASRLVYSDATGKTVCERSPVPLNL